MSLSKLNLCLYSVANLATSEQWLGLLADLQDCLESKLIRLDDKDPVRKKVGSLKEASEFICNFEPNHKSRWLWGKFENKAVDINIDIELPQSNSRSDLKLMFTSKYLETNSNIEAIVKAFQKGIRYFQPFFAYGDIREEFTQKRSATGFPINFQKELLGIFWLTYFSKPYVDFIGREKFAKLPLVPVEDDRGALIRLGERPDSDDFSVTRDEAEEILGHDHFVDPTSPIDKPVGVHALSYAKLREY